MWQGGEVVKKTTTFVVIVVLHLVAACAPGAPTPTRTPEPTATLAELRATSAEHIAGIWLWSGEVVPPASWGGAYYRWDADGTVWWADDAEMTTNLFSAKFWFEDGLYYEDENPMSEGLGIYEVYLRIQGGRAVILRMKRISDDVDDLRLRAMRYGDGHFFRRVD
jgi:hypothetical protein